MTVSTSAAWRVAAAACLSTSAAWAQSPAASSVEIYGLMDAVVRHASNAGAGGANGVNDGAYTGSRLGFRGREDLGGGLRAFFSLEQGIDPSTGTLQQSTGSAGLGQSATTGGRAFGRESLVGLATPFGTLTLGRQYTGAHLMSGRFQPQSNPNDAALSVFSGHHVARQDNMLRYGHRLGGLSFHIDATANEGNGKAWGASAAYNGGSWEVLGYAQDLKTNGAGADTRRIRGLGGNWKPLAGLQLYLGTMKRDHAVSKQVNKVVTGGLNYHLTELLVWTLSYTDDHQTGVNAGHRKVAFTGLNHFLSKRSDVYVEVDRNQVSGLYPLPGFMAARGSQTGVSLGLRHRF